MSTQLNAAQRLTASSDPVYDRLKEALADGKQGIAILTEVQELNKRISKVVKAKADDDQLDPYEVFKEPTDWQLTFDFQWEEAGDPAKIQEALEGEFKAKFAVSNKASMTTAFIIVGKLRVRFNVFRDKDLTALGVIIDPK